MTGARSRSCTLQPPTIGCWFDPIAPIEIGSLFDRRKKSKPITIRRQLMKEWALRAAIGAVQASAVLGYCFVIVCHIGL
jgi:hypothetical protein